MGHGTGVLRALFAWYALRGLTVGVAGTCSLFIAMKTGLPQNFLVAARGVGLTLGPAALGFAVGKMVWSGNSQVGVAAALACKMFCELVIPRTACSLVLYAAFFGIGVSTALLDIFGTLLMSRVHGNQAATKLMFYDTMYGLGCMVAPFLAVLDPEQAWNVLAGCDFALAAVVAGKRLVAGKPNNWKAKIRKLGSGDGARTEGLRPKPPARVVQVGMAFTFMAQFAMTAVSCWGFTYASTTLGIPPAIAATIPGSFYAACTVARMFVTGATVRVRAATIMHGGVLVTLVGAVAFYALDSFLVGAILAGAPADFAISYMPWLLACFMLMGIGFCPHYSLTVVAMQDHGDLAPQQHGWYATSTCLGITAGMFLPGFFSLAVIELFGTVCLLLILNSNARDFPRLAFNFPVVVKCEGP